ncbi:hypothetical protein ACUXV3_12035 [Roseobacteraceae bacterium NS-SX3]
MGRLIRLVFFVALAFTAGIFTERRNASERCQLSGGDWQPAGYCARD